MEVLSPRACHGNLIHLWGTQHCSKQNSDDDKVVFISSALTHSPAPSPPHFPFLAQRKERRSWMTSNISTTSSIIQGWLFCCWGEFNFAFLKSSYSVVYLGLDRWLRSFTEQIVAGNAKFKDLAHELPFPVFWMESRGYIKNWSQFSANPTYRVDQVTFWSPFKPNNTLISLAYMR